MKTVPVLGPQGWLSTPHDILSAYVSHAIGCMRHQHRHLATPPTSIPSAFAETGGDADKIAALIESRFKTDMSAVFGNQVNTSATVEPISPGSDDALVSVAMSVREGNGNEVNVVQSFKLSTVKLPSDSQ